MISAATIKSLCDDAGVAREDVFKIVIDPMGATFYCHSRDGQGNKYVNTATSDIQTHYVTAAIEHE